MASSISAPRPSPDRPRGSASASARGSPPASRRSCRLLGVPPLGEVGQQEEAAAGQEEQRQRQERGIGHPVRGIAATARDLHEIGDDREREGDREPAVDLSGPVVPVHGFLASSSMSFPPIIFQPYRAPPQFFFWPSLNPDCTISRREPAALGVRVKSTVVSSSPTTQR